MFVIKQPIPEIPGQVSCTKSTVVELLHDTSRIWIISGGGEIMASLLPLVTHTCMHQDLSYHINAKYMINLDAALTICSYYRNL